jgi:hypothetical protein
MQQLPARVGGRWDLAHLTLPNAWSFLLFALTVWLSQRVRGCLTD